MYRRTLIFGLLALYSTVCRAAAWALITKDEFERDLGAGQPLSRTCAAPGPLTHRLLK